MARKRFDSRHVVSWVVLACLFAWSVLVCRYSYIRLWESLKSCGLSLVYALFHRNEWCPAPIVNELPYVPVYGFFPKDWSVFWRNVRIFFGEFFSYYNFLGFVAELAPFLQRLTQLTLYLTLLGAILFVYFRFFHKPHQNTKNGGSTRAKRAYEVYELKVERPFFAYVKSCYEFFVDRWYYRVPFSLTFLLSINAASVFFSFFSYYFYFCASFDFLSSAIQLYKLTIDIEVAYRCLPLIAWIVLGFIVFDRITKNQAYDLLERHEWRNEVFLRMLGIVVFITGAMRTGKTSLVVDMLITKARIYRKDELDIMVGIHSEFVNFPFPVFIKTCNKLFDEGKVKSLRQCEKYIRAKRQKFENHPCTENIFGYDFEHYRLTYDNALTVENIFDRLCSFMKAYRLYRESTFFLTTFSVREDHRELTIGNFSKWDMDIFHRESFDVSAGTAAYSHALNWDMMRPGKKMDPESKVFGVLEYGIVGVAELDKERENNLELLETKKGDDECNQKNDLVERYIMMMGHSGMIEYKCFMSMFGDSQRESGWGAKGRETATVVKILENSETKLALKFFTYRDMLYDFCKAIHKSSVVKNWYNRGDTTLPAYLLWKFSSLVINYGRRIYNTFGYEESTLKYARGDGEGDSVEVKYYRSYKKARRAMYETASYKDYFGEANDKTEVKFSDIPRFKERCPSLEELIELLNSHFMNSFTKENESEAPKKVRKKKRVEFS